MSNMNLLILERSTQTLSFESDSKGNYVLEGIFGEMGVKNKNGRVYDESEYLPQVESLKEKINSGKLMGELDHPQNFDISLKNVSHVIEDISYDKETRQVRGKIRLLNTDAGRQAKALVDDGIPLHISSRAAGVVEGNGSVKIKKLFTYDLVADPGFENAQLNRINESFGFSNNGNVSIYEIDSPIPGLDAYIDNDKYNITNENNDTNKMEGVVKIEDFNTYSKHIAEQLNSLKSEVETCKSIKEANGSNPLLEEYIEQIRERMNGLIDNVTNLMDHNNHIVENVKNIKGYVEHVAEQSNNGFAYIEHVAEQADMGIQYIEDVAKKANHIIEHNNYIAEQVDNIAQYGDHLSEGLNQLADYSEYLKGNIETVGQYGDYTAENVKRIKQSLSAINEDKAEEIEDAIMKMGEPKQHTPEKGEEVVSESFNISSYKNDIAEKLDILIESAKKQTADLNGDLHFLRFLNDTEKNNFHSLNEDAKAKIITKSKDVTYTSSSDVKAIFESVINPVDRTPLFIKNIPDEYRADWEKSTTAKKKQIVAEAAGHTLNTDYQINNFWSTRDFRETLLNVQRIDEASNASSEKVETVDTYGVTNGYMDWFGQELAKKFNR